MSIHSIELPKLSLFHNGRTPHLSIFTDRQRYTCPLDDAAALAGVSRQTLTRWIDRRQTPPLSALRLFSVVYLGNLPWQGWQDFRIAPGRDQDNALRHLLTHADFRQFWTPERVLMIGHGYDRADELERTVATLRATINALTTRQPPPLPCAEIIPGPWAKKSPG